MIVIFQGLESPDHRRTLESVADLFDSPPTIAASVSYKSLRFRRLSSNYVREVAKTFPVVLEAGVSGSSMTHDEAMDAMKDYYTFLADVPEVFAAIQFDHSTVGEHALPQDERIVPVLFDHGDLARLDGLLNTWGQVAMVYGGDKRIPAVLRRHQQGGLVLALRQPNLAKAKRSGFNAAMTSAWISPGRYGEMSLWDGTKFHRVNSGERPALLDTYEHQVAEYGFDLDLLRNGDARESNRLSVFSFLLWAASLGEQLSDNEEGGKAAEPAKQESVSVSQLPKSVKKVRPTVPFPVFDSVEEDGLEEEPDGSLTIRKRGMMRASTQTIRVCDACYLAVTCPAYEAGSSCKFNFPAEVRSDAQVKALLHTMVEMQASRVAFARFAEEVNGGYPDPVVGQEMDRLVRMTDTVRRSEERREKVTLTMEAEATNGGTGVLSRIFGGRAQAVMAQRQPAAEVLIGELSDYSGGPGPETVSGTLSDRPPEARVEA